MSANPESSVPPVPMAATSGAPGQTPEATSLKQISPTQWKSGLAAWLGWMFDGLDMHLYTLVAKEVVGLLLAAQLAVLTLPEEKKALIDSRSAIIQAAFLLGWALGGGFFGRIGDRLGRSRALVLTILTYALFTGLSFFATTWWHLLIFRFMAALGIGGEWAVGASLLSETWPKRWRPWIAAVLQCAVNFGVMLAALTAYVLSKHPTWVFLVGVLPAFITLWIRRAVPETEEWLAATGATAATAVAPPGVVDLFKGQVRRTTLLTLGVCSCALTAHWAFIFWFIPQLKAMPEIKDLPESTKLEWGSTAFFYLMFWSMVGNFAASAMAKAFGYRVSIGVCCLGYCASLWLSYGMGNVYSARTALWCLLPLMGLGSGVFGLFTMYLPPLFPTLLRTTGAGFCYNIGRIAAAAGTLFFNLVIKVGDYGAAMRWAGLLFIPAAALAILLGEHEDPEHDKPTPEAELAE